MSGVGPVATHAFSATGQSGGCGAGRPDRAQTKDRRPECAAHRQIEYCMCAKASPGLAAQRRRDGRRPAPQLGRCRRQGFAVRGETPG